MVRINSGSTCSRPLIALEGVKWPCALRLRVVIEGRSGDPSRCVREKYPKRIKPGFPGARHVWSERVRAPGLDVRQPVRQCLW